MTVTFKQYRNRILSQADQVIVRKVLRTLDALGSYHADLQLMYNNPEHFTTVNFGICTVEQLQDIAHAARSNNDVIEVQGDVHENFHLSGVVLDAVRKHKLPVYDSYIRINYGGQLYHILLQPPRLMNYTYFVVKIVHGCQGPSQFIPPMMPPMMP